jgi:hypothetical protein
MTDHAKNGAIVLRRYVDDFDHGLDLKVREDYQAATADLIADLLHAGKADCVDFDHEDAVRSGLMHFEYERSDEWEAYHRDGGPVPKLAEDEDPPEPTGHGRPQ